jgi:hypothetical protein
MMPTYGYIWYMKSYIGIDTYSKFHAPHLRERTVQRQRMTRLWVPPVIKRYYRIFCPDLTLSLLSLSARVLCLGAWNGLAYLCILFYSSV